MAKHSSRAYVDREQNALVIEVDPQADNEKQVKSTIRDAADLLYTFAENYDKKLRELEKTVKTLETKAGFVDFRKQKEDYARLKEDLIRTGINPKIIVRGLPDKTSQEYFKDLLEDVKHEAADENERRNRRENYARLVDYAHGDAGDKITFGVFTLMTLGIAPAVSRYGKNKCETAKRRYGTLNYMSNNRKFE